MATHVALTFLSALGLNAVVARAHARALRGDGVETEHSGPEEGKAFRGLRGGLEAALGDQVSHFAVKAAYKLKNFIRL